MIPINSDELYELSFEEIRAAFKNVAARHGDSILKALDASTKSDDAKRNLVERYKKVLGDVLDLALAMEVVKKVDELAIDGAAVAAILCGDANVNIKRFDAFKTAMYTLEVFLEIVGIKFGAKGETK